MIFVDREKGRVALRDMTERTKQALADGRHVVLFPEGRRMTPGEPADLRVGLSYLYRQTGVPVVPVALNSGLYWPRKTFLRYPGRIIVEFLPAIGPGLTPDDFQRLVKEGIERASDRLILEADKARPRPPFPAAAAQRLAALRSSATTRARA
jgi:1-acyl-sn-glycerol-3-phosphate acyltransferase